MGKSLANSTTSIEIKNHLINDIIPFWRGLRDDTYGGYYGYLSHDLVLDKEAVKGCILNSRILWFFSNAYLTLKDEPEEYRKELLDEAVHAYDFLKKYCYDYENGGVYWSLKYNGEIYDSTKHTYNQAFAIYALSSYYDASKDESALELAKRLQETIENKCTDEIGYLEAFTRDFGPESNEKLSENGVMAEKTMNTLLHVFEAYCEYYRVTGDEYTREKIVFILDILLKRIYNPALKRQEVFFDKYYNPIIDLHSYGHDIETSWLLQRGLEILDIPEITEKLYPICDALTETVYKRAFVDGSLLNECENGVDNTIRMWWVQAETLVGLMHAYLRNPDKTEYLEGVNQEWNYIKDKIIDKRPGSEWYYAVFEDGTPDVNEAIVEEWKCPYHNGRMCMEVIKASGI